MRPAILLDVLGLHPVDPCHLAIGSIEPVQEMVELRVNRLRIPVLGPLNEDGHHPRRKRRDRVPVKRLAGKGEPQNTVAEHDEERCRARREDARGGLDDRGYRQSLGNRVRLRRVIVGLTPIAPAK